MGLIDFVKSAGQKIFGGDDEPKPQNQAKVREYSAEEVRQINERRAAARLVTMVEGLGFEVEGLSIKVAGDVATVSGKIASQQDREKVVLAVGNTAGIGQVDDQLEVETDEPEATYYTVQSGDSLSKIAKQQYGNAMKYPHIFEANKPMLSDPDKIYPGQVLRIPPLAD
ncbi:MAG: peptidoglycan-binding protein LysM [Acidobacteriota bacterium]|nr:peptidoglycan-binding protein LysM [Acidobacteriota bacterium]